MKRGYGRKYICPKESCEIHSQCGHGHSHYEKDGCFVLYLNYDPERDCPRCVEVREEDPFIEEGEMEL